MAVLNVITWPAKVLEEPAADVDRFDDEFSNFVADMFETMDKAIGVGLAANQVARLQRVFVVHISYNEEDSRTEERMWWHDKRFAFVNPKIVRREGRVRVMEGCLSFPDVYEWVDRADKVTIEAVDEKGKPFSVEADGLLSICIQHELDHLDGVVFTKRMSRLKANMIRKKMQKRALIEG